jgi:hypothetical protein
MQFRGIIKTVIGALVLLMAGGCVTPPEVKTEIKEVIKEKKVLITQVPLTQVLLKRLSDSLGKTQNEIIRDCQLYISGRVTLETDSIVLKDKLEGGKPILEDRYIKTIREIKALTLGMTREGPLDQGSKKIVKVGFEQGVETNLMVFAQAGAEGYFYLNHDPLAANTPITGDEKGTIQYGNTIYKIKYSERPYLLIQIDQKYGEDTDYKEIKGWKYGPN